MANSRKLSSNDLIAIKSRKTIEKIYSSEETYVKQLRNQDDDMFTDDLLEENKKAREGLSSILNLRGSKKGESLIRELEKVLCEKYGGVDFKGSDFLLSEPEFLTVDEFYKIKEKKIEENFRIMKALKYKRIENCSNSMKFFEKITEALSDRQIINLRLLNSPSEEFCFHYLIAAMDSQKGEEIILKVYESSTEDQTEAEILAKMYENELNIYKKLQKTAPGRFHFRYLRMVNSGIYQLKSSNYIKLHIIEFEKYRTNLRNFLEKEENLLTSNDFQKIVFDILETLYHLHTNEIYHGNIKPENIFYSETQGNWIIGDFSFGEIIDPKEVTFQLNNLCLIQEPRGSLLYMSPEMKSGIRKNQDQVKQDPFQADLYSLGLVMLFMKLKEKSSKKDIKYFFKNQVELKQFIIENPVLLTTHNVSFKDVDEGKIKYPNLLDLILNNQETKLLNVLVIALLFNLKPCLESQFSLKYLEFSPVKAKSGEQKTLSYSHDESLFYEGDYKFDQVSNTYTRVGTGTLFRILENGKKRIIYEGGWKDDLPHGFGFEFISDFFKYEGNFNYGEKHGSGKLILNGYTVIFEGKFFRNVPPDFYILNKCFENLNEIMSLPPGRVYIPNNYSLLEGMSINWKYIKQLGENCQKIYLDVFCYPSLSCDLKIQLLSNLEKVFQHQGNHGKKVEHVRFSRKENLQKKNWRVSLSLRGFDNNPDRKLKFYFDNFTIEHDLEGSLEEKVMYLVNHISRQVEIDELDLDFAKNSTMMNNQIKEKYLEWIGSVKRINKLNLNFAEALSFTLEDIKRVLESLPKGTFLQNLNITGVNNKDGEIFLILIHSLQCSKLKKLEMDGVYLEYKESEKIFKKLEFIRTLSLKDCLQTFSKYEFSIFSCNSTELKIDIEHLPKALEEIYLDRNYLTPEIIKSKFKNKIKILSLNDLKNKSTISNIFKTLIKSPNMESLQELYLDKLDLTSDILKVLITGNFQLKLLSLRSNEKIDEGFFTKIIAGGFNTNFNALQSLYVSNTQFNDAAIDALLKNSTLSKTLRDLDLSLCSKVSSEGLYKILRRNNNLNIQKLWLNELEAVSGAFAKILDAKNLELGNKVLSYLSILNCGDSTDFVAQILCLISGSNYFPTLKKIKINDSFFFNQLYYIANIVLPKTQCKINRYWFYYFDEQFKMEEKNKSDLLVSEKKTIAGKARKKHIKEYTKVEATTLLANLPFLNLSGVIILSFSGYLDVSESGFVLLGNLMEKLIYLRSLNLESSSISAATLSAIILNSHENLSAINSFNCREVNKDFKTCLEKLSLKDKLVCNFRVRRNSSQFFVYRLNENLSLFFNHDHDLLKSCEITGGSNFKVLSKTKVLLEISKEENIDIFYDEHFLNFVLTNLSESSPRQACKHVYNRRRSLLEFSYQNRRSQKFFLTILVSEEEHAQKVTLKEAMINKAQKKLKNWNEQKNNEGISIGIFPESLQIFDKFDSGEPIKLSIDASYKIPKDYDLDGFTIKLTLFTNLLGINLEIRGGTLTELGCSNLKTVLKSNPNLLDLKLGFKNTSIDQRLLEIISESFDSASSKIRRLSLDLRSNKLESKCLNPISKIIDDSPCLTELKLNFKKNNLEVEGCKNLAKALAKRVDLKILSLNFSNNNIRNDGASELVGSVLNCFKIESFKISFRKNLINKSSAVDFAAITKSLKYLKSFSIDLSNTDLKDEGFELLFNSIALGKKLTSLSLICNNCQITSSVQEKLMGVFNLSNKLENLHISLCSNQIGKSSSKFFFLPSLKNLKKLRTLELNLSSNFINDEQIRDLCEKIETQKDLKYFCLDVSKNQITENGCTGLDKVISDLRAVKELIVNFQDNNTGKVFGEKLFETMGKKKLNKLGINLAKTNLGKTFQIKHIFEPDFKELTHFDINLNSNSITNEGLNGITEFAKANEDLEFLEISLSGNMINKEGGSHIGNFLMKGLKSFKLNISSNFIGKDGGSFLFKSLESIQELLYLDINFSNNHITKKGSIEIMQILSRFTSLEYFRLELVESHIEKEGAKALGDGVGGMKNLKTLELNLSGNNIGDISLLSDSIDNLKSLRKLSLNLSGNTLITERFQDFVNVVKNLNLIKLTLIMKKNSLEKREFDHFFQLFYSNSRLNSLTLDFEQNNIDYDAAKKLLNYSQIIKTFDYFEINLKNNFLREDDMNNFRISLGLTFNDQRRNTCIV